MNFDLSKHINNELCRLASGKLNAEDVIGIIKKFIDGERSFVCRLKYNRLIFYKKGFVSMQEFTKKKNTDSSNRLHINLAENTCFLLEGIGVKLM